jgi:hypothetical protein
VCTTERRQRAKVSREYAPRPVPCQGDIDAFSAPVVFRRKARRAGNGPALGKRRNAAAGHHRGALRVGLSAPLAALRLAYVAVLHRARRAFPGTLTGQLNASISP